MSITPTYSEFLLINRRRLGLTQAQMAKQYGFFSHVYARLENADEKALSMCTLPIIKVKGLKPNERCVIMRRRCGTTQSEIAQKLGCSRYWLNQMELGKVCCDDLIWFWEQ